MTIKQTIRNMAMGAVLIVPFFVAFLVVTPTFAAEEAANAGNNGCGTDTAIIKCNNLDPDAEGVEASGLWSLLLTAINILTAGVGVLALGGIVYGAVLYTSAGGNPEQVKKARTIFMNVAIGVVAFAGMFALLNFIIPGGVFDV